MLWHIDSNHKLISWRFVIHGCIDGFSRAIVYLACCTDNTANTVLKLFEKGVEEFGLPSRVCGDHGVENLDVAWIMVSSRGTNVGAKSLNFWGFQKEGMAERSVHNQRIECLWTEVNWVMTALYKDLCKYLERNNLLNSLNETYIYALRYVFLPKIYKSIDEFHRQWNHHGMLND